jgi:aminoglycoside phosphotransferase (APT) family kinase protein
LNGLRAWPRDPQLPARAGEPQLAPPDEAGVLGLVSEHLLRRGAPPPVAAEWTYARWKPGVAVSAAFALRFADDAERLVHVKRYAGDKAGHVAARHAPFADEPGRGPPDERLRPGAALPGEHLLLSCFPHDRELPGLPRLLDLHRTKRLLAEAGTFGDRVVRTHRSSARLLRYRPEARAVLCLELGLKAPGGARSTARMAARVLPPPRAAGVIAMRRAAPMPAAAPRLLAVEERTGLLFEEWLEVETRAPDDFSHAPQAGAALAALHVPVRGAGAGRQRRLAALQPLFAWHPRLASLSAGARAPAADAPPCWTHGDVHPDQVALALTGGAPALLDLDRLAPGQPADDLASWIADALAAQPELSLADAGALLLDGYAAAGGDPPAPRALAACVAVVLVARAAAVLRRLQAGAVDEAARLLARARDLAPRGSVFA